MMLFYAVDKNEVFDERSEGGIERSVKKMCQWHIFSDWRESEHRPEKMAGKAEQVPPFLNI